MGWFTLRSVNRADVLAWSPISGFGCTRQSVNDMKRSATNLDGRKDEEKVRDGVLMRIGLIARADKTGLGIQTYEFYRHMKPDKVLVVDLSSLLWSISLICRCTQVGQVWHDKRYPGTEIFHDPVVDEFLKDLDVVFTCETPYSYYLYVKAH
jgi:hypothetical protein